MTAYQVKFTALPLYRLGYFYPNKFTPKYKCSHREKGNKNIAPNERCDKQFGSNGASLFIFRVCLIGKRRILYALFFKKCLKKYFSGFYNPYKKFLQRVINSSAGILPHCLSGEFASSADVALLYNMQFCKSKTA